MLSAACEQAAKSKWPHIKVIAAEPAGANQQPDVALSLASVGAALCVLCTDLIVCGAVSTGKFLTWQACSCHEVDGGGCPLQGRWVGFPDVPAPATICDGLRGHTKDLTWAVVQVISAARLSASRRRRLILLCAGCLTSVVDCRRAPGACWGGQDWVDGAVAVSDHEVLAAMRLVFERMKLVIEPSAAVGLAALLHPSFRDQFADGGGQRCGRRFHL